MIKKSGLVNPKKRILDIPNEKLIGTPIKIKNKNIKNSARASITNPLKYLISKSLFIFYVL